ncbi:hypothetical protein C8J57DRAFT_1721980 [Mycena rebaudengoi]|nr:hypothetical protein C8J57DRAFT_1721980 [Mycena rebaudengoi]
MYFAASRRVIAASTPRTSFLPSHLPNDTQSEAHASAIKFQRRTIDTSSFYERIAQLEAGNAQLTSELAVLRPTPAPPLPAAASDSAAAAEITFTLCCLSAKLSLTETALQEPTTPLVQANSLAAEHNPSAHRPRRPPRCRRTRTRSSPTSRRQHAAPRL